MRGARSERNEANDPSAVPEASGVSSAVEHLPYKQGVAGSNPALRTNRMPLLRRKPRVLLLDDDPSMQRLVSTLLKREGYRVDLYLTGREAIAAIAAEKFSAIILDLMMPNEGGLTVIRHLETQSPDTLKHVLVLTGSSSSVVDTIRKSVAVVVQKPFEPDELTAAVKRLLEP